MSQRGVTLGLGWPRASGVGAGGLLPPWWVRTARDPTNARPHPEHPTRTHKGFVLVGRADDSKRGGEALR
ncbi:hypothetical protein [Boudabousia tangfeifanii]|uniref:hypothetical protein n=1 Tax=Boudabousia tangfeifanii TaxID=1912795 RepID=UPI0012EEC993|nr:hypothetical protein [Boudabousia tangfeifanii]